jgi:hypothetical protein
MRKAVAGVLVGALTLAMAAIAMAATGTSGTTVQTYSQSYTTKHPKTSAGTNFATSSTDPQNSARNNQPKRVTNFDIVFPKGAKIDSTAAPQCKATENDFANSSNPDDACPKGSKLGTGTVAARTPFNGVADFTGTVSAYNANKGLLLFVNVSSANQTLLLKPKFSGVTLKTIVPQTCIPPNIPQNDCKDSNGISQEAILTSFTLKINATSKGKGKKKKNLLTTPPTCPAGGWTFTANIKYADSSTVKIPTKSPCSKK